ncbi:hypothetical protein BDW66DRAFT_56513 [Aspergillus desertorum]
MSNQSIPPAPPYWRANYTQQWTTQPPPSSGSMPDDLQFNPDPSFDPQQYHNLHTFYANANLPGLGGAGATGTFPPPPFAFPGNFPPAAGAPPFAAMPNVGYPLMPLPPVPSQMQPLQPSTNNMDYSAIIKAPDHNPTSTTKSNLDLDREEGELTDIEGPATTEQEPHSSQNTRHPRSNNSDSQRFRRAGSVGDNRAPIRQSQLTSSNELHAKDKRFGVSTSRRESLSELEEGEASPEPRTSSRASGSPYNPPMPTNVISPPMSKSSPEVLKTTSREVDTTNLSVPASTDSKGSSGSAVSLAQLRVQAQGALLSLAPHNIRYSELVGEGINPTILKQLYEEVGIKVPTTPPADVRTRAGFKETAHASAESAMTNGQAKQPTKQIDLQLAAGQTASTNEPSCTTPHYVLDVPASATKPMERKEVIARMLAAKAAKSSPASAPPSDATQTAPSVQTTPATVEKSTLSTPSQDSAANEKETRLREKNKAQTELARQRIEQLKKQGLMRNFQKPQPDLDKEQGIVQESRQPQRSTIVQHPLPERPPLPQSASLDQIPGLFMTEQVPPATNGAHITLVQDRVCESATHSRSSQRKRPRASDFDDDPTPVPKKAFSNGTNHQIPAERLIIDISDDEFYDYDERSMDGETASTGPSMGSGPKTAEGLPRTYPAPAGSLPHRPATSQSHSFSTASTPSNFRSSEQDDLKKKDLEIQAMHRKIAELEQRKKAKLASRTQSPRASDLSTPDIVSMPAVPTPSTLPALPIATDKKMENVLATMNADGLRTMKSQILRMQEIEAGVPSLDAVIRKTEMKLANARREVEELSSELARGKEGRQHLIEELNALKLEVAGLSLERVNAALSIVEAKKELPVEAIQALTSDNEAVDERASAVPEVPEADALTQKDTASPSHADLTAPNSPSVKDRSDAPNIVKDAPDLNAPAEELTDTSMSDSSSSMDESSDDSSSESGSLNEEMPDAPESNTNPATPGGEVNTIISPGLPNGPENLHGEQEPLSGNQPPNTQTTVREDPGANCENLASRESPVSEAYEPPEPEESTNASDSNYSPAASHDFNSPVPKMEVSGSSEDQSKEAGEPLSKKVQELDFQQPGPLSQIGPLDNSRHTEDSHRKLTPYTSPLRLFRAYRYHPNYNDNVSGGYRSLTYSHNIDPLKHLCPFETSGGVCNDRSCEFQHFRDMALSDDKILIQMGSLREGKTTEESDKYVAGLKEAINDMRRDKVKDFNTVAAEIVAYRRRFLQDPTRVLAL